MKITCLNTGGGFHFPPCHMLNFCGFRMLLDCPVDLSPLAMFSPVPISGINAFPDKESGSSLLFGSSGSESVVRKRPKIEKPLHANSLIHAEPWYKTVNNLHLWNVSLIDVVLISSPMGMLGLPFLTRMKGFSAEIYVTEASARLGQLMMEDLVSMHVEFRQFYGPGESVSPQWLREEEIDLLPAALRKIVLGKDGVDLGSWMPLYSAADVKDCMQRVHKLKYAEETSYNGILIIKALSSGLEIGSCNWVLKGPRRDISYISNSIFVSSHAMNFNYRALCGSDTIIYSDLSALNEIGEYDSRSTVSSTNKDVDDSSQQFAESLLSTDENLDERETIRLTCYSAVECIKAGGSVLIPINRLGTVIQILEQLSTLLVSSAMEVPIYFISSVAEELLAFIGVVPEWLCEERQQKLFSGEPLFAFAELRKEKKLHVFSDIQSHNFVTNWQEPCIVFSPHWSLRLGPVVHFLRCWHQNPNSLLILEDGLDPELALLPFMPIAMKVLRCVFPSGIRLQKMPHLLKFLQPKMVLFPEDLKQRISFSNESSFSILYYSGETLHVPCQKNGSELEIAADLATQFKWKNLKQNQYNISRLKGELLIEHGKHRIFSGNDQGNSLKNWPLMCWGSLHLGRLIAALSEAGIHATLEQGMNSTESETDHIVHVYHPQRALIKFGTSTVVCAADGNLASQILEAIDTVLDGI